MDAIHFRDAAGELLWCSPASFPRLLRVGEKVCREDVVYVVRRVSLADGVQHVNLDAVATDGTSRRDTPDN
jgi:hypothetical protein